VVAETHHHSLLILTMTPTSPRMKELEELELGDEDDSRSIGAEELEDLPLSPVLPTKASSESTTSPVAIESTPSKVKAAAAKFGGSISPPSRPPVKVSPSSSFRSISAATVSKTSPEKRPANIESSPAMEELEIEDTAPAEQEFADIPLSTVPIDSNSLGPVPVFQAKSYSLSPAPPPVEIMAALPDPVVTPPAKEEPKKTGFFSLGFGASPATSTTPTPITSAQASRSTSTTGQLAVNPPPNVGWRSTMSNLFVSRSASATSPNMDSPAEMTPVTAPGPSRQQSTTSSTSFLINRISSTPASRDRRMSKEMGGGEKLREGFERVRNEMEGAAREMRRERQATASTSGSGSSDEKGKDTRPVSEVDIDWSFWGAVVQDYEQVAVSRPKDLSKAIQHGIPPVIR
jgi:hypothetical protein